MKDLNDKKTMDFVAADKTVYTAGQALVSKRERVDKCCLVCDELMTNVYATKECCSSTCRSRKKRNPEKYEKKGNKDSK